MFVFYFYLGFRPITVLASDRHCGPKVNGMIQKPLTLYS